MAAKRKKQSSLTPALVVLNLLIFSVIALMIFFVYQFITSEDAMPEERTTPVPRTVRAVADTITTSVEVETSIEEVTEVPVSMTKAKTTTPEPITSPNDDFETIDIVNYDIEYFKNDLFIGDSIMTGFSGFGFLPIENVFAKIGLNPETIHTTKVDDITAEQRIKNMQPERIYIMLGTNGLAFFSAEVMGDYLGIFIDKIKTDSPNSKIIIMTIPPVTKTHDAAGNETMTDIKKYNDILKELASYKDCTLADVCALLIDDTGYFSDKYAEQDGLHFLGTAYKAVLSFLQQL